MQTLLKRLEMIKNSIVLGDEDLIPIQLSKLPPSKDAMVNTIVTCLHNAEYAQSATLIEDFVSRHAGLVVYEDSAVAGLKLELKSLEAKLLQLNEDKQNAQQLLHDFHVEYSLALGDILQGILDCKYRIHYQKNLNKLKARERLVQARDSSEGKIADLKATIKDLQSDDLDVDQPEALLDAVNDLIAEIAESQAIQDEIDAFDADLDDDADYQAYQEARQDKESFEEEFEEVREQHKHELPEEDKARLKKAYRKASRLCHPDTVAEEFKEQAHEIMSALNVARDQQDLAEVERILALLESGAGFVASSDRINDSKQLRGKIAELRHSIQQVQAEIEAITQDADYHKIRQLEDWPEYFATIKVDLEERLANLELQYERLLAEDRHKENESVTTPLKTPQPEEDTFWTNEF